MDTGNDTEPGHSIDTGYNTEPGQSIDTGHKEQNGEETGQQQTKENIRFQKRRRRTAGQAEDGPLKGALAECGSASGFV